MEQYTTDTNAAGSAPAEWSIPREGVTVTHCLIVRDVSRSRHL